MTPTLRFAAAAALAAFVAVPVAHAQTGKIAYINSQRIMAESPGRAEAEKTYDTEMTSVRAQLQKMDDSLKTLVEAYQKEAAKMDSAARVTRELSLRNIEEDLSKQAQELNQRMQQRQVELARPLLEQVSKVLDDLRMKNNYAMIFDVGSQASVVVSADKNLDITEQVLAELKRLGPPKPVSAPPSSVPIGPTTKPSGVSRPRG